MGFSETTPDEHQPGPSSLPEPGWAGWGNASAPNLSDRATGSEPKQQGRVRKAIGSILAAIVGALKWGALLFSKLKFAGVLLSMLISIGAYTLLWGWKFAVGFVLILLVHEYGHVIQLRREGVPATAPRFIPFLGAYIGMKQMPPNAAAEARVGLAGPIAGTVASLVPFAIWRLTGNPFWQTLAFIGFWLQLFNLAPVLPLDGGRAMSALSTKVWLLGWAGMVVLALYEIVHGNSLAILLVLIAIMGGVELYRRFKRRHTPESQAYHNVRGRTRLAIAAVYFALILGTGFASAATYFKETISQASHHQVASTPAPSARV